MSVRLAMWSGPRNISTAMMRSWENREDTVVVDEPLYAHYLEHTGLQHPGFEDVIRSQSTDYKEVTAWLTGPIPDGRTIWYQKHMTHHLLPHMDRAWMADLVHCFLIRDPRRVLASYAKARPDVTLEDLGFVQQAEIFDFLTEKQGKPPLVLSSRDVLTHPERMLTRLCEALGVPFTPRMLTWPSGPRDSDGVWAPHWYSAVLKSTGFQPYVDKPVEYPLALASIAEAAREPYEHLYAHRLQP